MPTEQQAKQIYSFAKECLNHEIERFWKRALFFWGFIGAAFVAYGVLVDKNKPGSLLAVSCFGLICSVAWTLANRGSKYWQWAWEEKLKRIETKAAIFGEAVYGRDEPNTNWNPWGGWRLSVSKLTVLLSDFTVLVWLALGYVALPSIQPWWSNQLAWMVTITAAWVILMLIGGRSRR